MKNYLLIGLSVLTLAPMVLAEPLKLADDSAAFKYTLKTSKDTSLELTNKNVIEKKFEIKVRPSKKIQYAIRDSQSNSFEIILSNSEDEIVFEANQLLEEYNGKEKNFKAITYFSAEETNAHKVSLQCFEHNKSVEANSQTEAKKTLSCLKTEGCKSYATKENHFELTETPICIGSKEATVITKKANVQLTCMMWVGGKDNSKAILLTQVLDTKNISEIKSSEKCN